MKNFITLDNNNSSFVINYNHTEIQSYLLLYQQQYCIINNINVLEKIDNVFLDFFNDNMLFIYIETSIFVYKANDFCLLKKKHDIFLSIFRLISFSLLIIIVLFLNFNI